MSNNTTRQNKNTRKKQEFKLRYSFLTLVLLICLAHVGVSAFINISKTINYQGKIHKMNQLKQKAAQDNVKLKEELDDFSSLKSLEAIARNNLKMAGDDEVLVIINKKAAQSAQPPVQDKKGIKKKADKLIR